MANKKISELAQASPLLTTDEIVVQRGAAPPNLRATIQQVVDLALAGSGTPDTLPVWTDGIGGLGNSIIRQVGTRAIVEREVEARAPLGGNAGFIVYQETNILDSEGFIVYDFQDANSVRQTYARLVGILKDNTVGAISGMWQAEIMVAGVNTYLLQLDGSASTKVLLNANSKVTGTFDVTGRVKIGTATTITPSVVADDFVVDPGIEDVGLTLVSTVGGAGSANIYFASNASAIAANITFGYTAQLLEFGIAGSTEFSISTTDVTVATNHVTLTAGNFIVAAGTVSIGIASGDGTLHAHTGSAGAVTANAQADDGIFENSTHAGASILGPDNVNLSLYFGSPGANPMAFIIMNHDTPDMRLGTNLAAGTMSLATGAQIKAVEIDTSQNVKMVSLAGSGSRTVVAAANGTLSAP